MLNEWHSYEAGSTRRAAALASLFMALANNGGLNAFLTSTHDFDAQEVVDALSLVGAAKAELQLASVLQGLGVPLPASSQSERWDTLDAYWTDTLDELDTLSSHASDQLTLVLGRHVQEHESFYLGLGPDSL